MDRKRPTKKPESQHLHKTREYRLPLIIYDILRNGETTGRRLEKTRSTGRGVANSGPLAQLKIHLISIQCESKSQKTMRRSVLRISLFIFRTISIKLIRRLIDRSYALICTLFPYHLNSDYLVRKRNTGLFILVHN